MARPKSGVVVAIDGITFKASKSEVCDYLFARLAGETHGAAARHLEHAIVSTPLFNLPVDASVVALTKALKSVLIVHSTPKGE